MAEEECSDNYLKPYSLVTVLGVSGASFLNRDLTPYIRNVLAQGACCAAKCKRIVNLHVLKLLSGASLKQLDLTHRLHSKSG